MKTFLHTVAADMLKHFSHDMRDVMVVFPGKRAGMFLSRELALLSDKPVWAPRYCTMSDLFLSLTPIREADSTECICQLYAIMQEVLGPDYTESIDEFWSWGEVLMSDFDDIDKHLANAKAIFTNMADQERLKNLDYLDENQRETLKRFFGRFSLENSTRIQKKFLQTWDHMYDIYTRLHDRLFGEGKLWEGALFRYVTERMKADESLVEKLVEGKQAIVFAGFNVLNDVEQSMMNFIKREGKARFYWDYDIYYCDPKKNYEAGDFMKQNLSNFPNAISEPEAFDNFSQLTDVTFVACATDNAAARYVNTYIEELRIKKEELRIKKEELRIDSSSTFNSQLSTLNFQLSTLNSQSPLSVVLCNEGLLLPVLHSIPEEIKEVNVTMGFPISDTPVYGIVMSLMKLQMEGYDADHRRFRYPFVLALRRQPFFALLREEDCFVYHGDNTAELLDWLLVLLRQVASHYAQVEELSLFEQLYSETTFRIDRMLCLLRSQLSTFNFQLSTQIVRRLLRQMMTSTKIPFHSEPDRGLQVMGMLETRCLNFEHLLMLSVEEGSLPRSSHANSFIPESLREAFGLTTQRHRIDVYAYSFYRLVSRCKHLTCVYNESTNDGTQHEMSRFLRQMLAETDIPIRTLWLQSEPTPKASKLLEVEKTAEVMDRLLHRYDQNLPEGEHITLSPSAINSYMACPMQFYLNNVLRIRREDDPEEGISADIIGNIFHDTAEFFYEWLQQRYGTDTITADMLCDKNFAIRETIHRELQRMLHAAFDVCWFHPSEEFDRLPELRRRFKTLSKGEKKSFPLGEDLGEAYKGTTLIAHDVLLRYLQELIRYDARHAPFRIVGAEEERTIEFTVQNSKLKIGGRIDRIDEMDGRLRIVDYKTGTYKLKDKLKMENVVSLEKEHERYYLQIFLYALAEMERKESSLPIKPVLFFPIRAAVSDYDPSLMLDGETVDDFANQHADTFREGLQNILADIFNPEKPFACTSNPKVCEYCKLGQLCGRGSTSK